MARRAAKTLRGYKQKAPGTHNHLGLLGSEIPPVSGASHGIATIQALVTGTVAHGDRAANVARGRVLHEVLDRLAELLHRCRAAAARGGPGRDLPRLRQFLNGTVDNLFFLFGHLLEWQFALAGVRCIGLAIAGHGIKLVGPLRNSLFAAPLVSVIAPTAGEQNAALAVNQFLTLKIFQPSVVVTP